MPHRRRTPEHLLIFVLLAGCGGSLPFQIAEPAGGAEDVTTVLYLVGDAGDPDPRGEPVLTALEGDIRQGAQVGERLLVFLGDNVYPRGLPPEGAAERPEAERRLAEQVDLAVRTGTPTIFIPGNHDWDFSGPDGWASVRRQEAFVEARGAGLVSFLPDEGCPGPVRREVGEQVRLVLLDTEWWLRSGDKPRHPSSNCAADSPEEVIEALGLALDDPGDRQVVVVGHHPLMTAGPHGGNFGFRNHLFPLVDWKGWLWVPLPAIGSIYPIARRRGISEQDMSGGLNRAMRVAIEGALVENPPLAWVSGHVHGLEALDGGDLARILLVSGAGIYGHVSPIAALEQTLYAGSHSGYAKMEFEASGRVRVSILAVDGEGNRHEVWASFLEE